MLDILTNKQVKEKFGKKPFFNAIQLISTVDYMAGVEYIDDIVKESWNGVSHLTNLIARPQGLEIQVTHKMKQYSVGISNDRITRISMEDRDQIYYKKDRSVINRAIIGGFLLGPLGAVVGGISGLQQSTNKLKMPDLNIIIEFNDDKGHKRGIMFGAKFKKKKEVHNFFSKAYPELFYLEKEEQPV